MTLTQGDFATEERLELQSQRLGRQFREAGRGPQGSRSLDPGPRPSFSTVIQDGYCISWTRLRPSAGEAAASNHTALTGARGRNLDHTLAFCKYGP